MYVPPHFRETDHAKLLDFVEQHSFGLLVSQMNGEPFATHLPLLVERQAAGQGLLIGHVARANPHWQTSDRQVLAVFSGPHAYISPTWYEDDDVVPTWNYVAVHVYGTLSLVEGHQDTIDVVRRYVAFYERSLPRPWKLPERDPYIEKLARAIVGFRIAITRIEGKWKLNQNHPRGRREKVVAQLESRDDENSQAIAALMAETLEQDC